MIYDKYYNRNAQSLISSTKMLFAYLDLELLSADVVSSVGLADCGGYWARLVQKDDLLRNVAYNLALANAANATLVFLEEDAYANAFYAKTLIESHTSLMREIETQYLHRFNLLYDSKVQMSYLPDLLNSLDITPLVQKQFHSYLFAMIRGAYYGHLPKSTNYRIYEQIGLKAVELPFVNQYYAHLLANNPQSAYYNTGKYFFDIADLGVDFILSYSLSQFDMLDSHRTQLCKAYNRDDIALPILFLPQVLLLAFGEKDKKKLGFTHHKQKVEIF